MEPPSPKHEPKRKHVTTACVACRESKVKCNGATPTCSNCQSKGKECRYQAREDKRKLSLRVAIELLFGRVQQLSQFINAQSLDIPSMPPDDQETLSGILRTLGLPQVTTFQDKADNENSTLQGSTAQWLDQRLEPPHPDAEAQGMNVPDMPNLEDSRGGSHPAVRSLLELANAADNMGNINQNPSSWDWNLATGAISQESVVHPDCIPTGPAGQPFLRNASSSPQLSVSMEMPSCRPSLDDDGVSTTQSVDDLGDKLSDRVGTLHIRPGGHIRFYGSTSNFNLLDTPAASVTMNVHRTIRSDGVEHLERLGLNKDVPTKIEQHLMNLYFTWQDPSFHTVDRTMFEEAGVVWLDKGEDTSYYSEALKNAM
ncbi:hypothetical protein PVAG01_11478 [Phlyctema vagabunda]|uniref:Zn(2)-C6 fungal-type domain-containing protein n=1 Tax=Phlyctema vagabunda TaxID=108571 RepID=A0ABR4P166_9HELO